MCSCSIVTLVLVFFCTLVSSKKLNVLFLVSDDMRPELGAYYSPNSPFHPNMHTPHLDNLARRSLLLKRAYVQQALCNPSRTSLLTGRRPDTTRVYNLQHYWRNVGGGDFTTIPQYFKQNGYTVQGMGKIFHDGRTSSNNDPISWTEPYFVPDGSAWKDEVKFSWWAANKTKVQEHPLVDQQIAAQAKEALKSFAEKSKTSDQPFFLGVGFKKPHLPFIFPEEFLDFYPSKSIKLPNNPFAPVNMPEVAWSNFQKFRQYHVDIVSPHLGAANTTLPDSKVIELRRAYYAAISYVDSLVGDVLNTLEEEGLANSTIVSFFGDHGWQLGEHGEWGKCTNFELAVHAPMLLHVPGLTDNGVSTEALIEFVDLFPTLVEAAGLPRIPLCPQNSSNVDACTEGVSFMTLATNPEQAWKTGAFSQYPRMSEAGDNIMGYTVRTDRYRFTQWRLFDDLLYKPCDHHPLSEELYDHGKDSEENWNVVDETEYADARTELDRVLSEGWRHALPPVRVNVENEKQNANNGNELKNLLAKMGRQALHKDNVNVVNDEGNVDDVYKKQYANVDI